MIITVGESVYDIIFKNGKATSSVFGGSMFNVAVSLGRLKAKVAFAGFRANDRIGNESASFLKENNVDVTYFRSIDKAKSNLALAFLDEKGVPSYSFYRDENLNHKSIDIKFDHVDLLLVGSFFAINENNFEQIIKIINQAKTNNTVIAYDPNIRNHKIYQDIDLLNKVKHIIKSSDFVKLSDEDLIHITGSESLDSGIAFLDQQNVRKYVVTRGAKPAKACFDGICKLLPIPEVKVVSTVGAGDATSAGILCNGSSFLNDSGAFFKAVERGLKFGSHVCALNDNFISKGFNVK